jgi:hypothetical protein
VRAVLQQQQEQKLLARSQIDDLRRAHHSMYSKTFENKKLI